MLSRFYRHILIMLALLVSGETVHAITPTPTPTPSPTRTVSFAWKASISPGVIGYKIFWGTGSRNYQNVRDVKNVVSTSLTLSKTNQYYVAVSAYSLATSSGMSNEVIVPISW
jgi:hypothetical protein